MLESGTKMQARRVVKRVATLGRGAMVARLILVQQIAVRVRSSQPSCKARARREMVGCRICF